MSIADDYSTNSFFNNSPVPNGTSLPEDSKPSSEQQQRSLHRVSEVRQQQGVSIRSAARRMGITPEQVRQQEAATADMKLSQLHRWQEALEVPIADLLVEHAAPLSSPVLDRARMLRAMKTVRAIVSDNKDPAIARMATMLENQLLEIMPELADVSAWHSVGQRRTQDEVGRIAERPVSDSFARDALG